MRKALIIDDSSFSVRRLKKVMDELGFESVGVSNGPDALDALLGFVDGARALLRALLEGNGAQMDRDLLSLKTELTRYDRREAGVLLELNKEQRDALTEMFFVEFQKCAGYTEGVT